MSTVAYIGASRGVGFAAYADLAAAQPNVRSVLLLRKPDVLKESPPYLSLDPTIKERTTLLTGDAHNSDSVEGLLDECGSDLKAIVYSIGFTPPSGFSAATKAIAKGFPIEPPDLCSRGFILLLQALRRRYDSYAVDPKIVLVSSMGLGKVAHGTIPFALRLLHTMVLEHPHADKIAMEVALSKALLPSEESYPRFFPAPSEISPKVTTLAAIDAAISPFIAPQDVCVVRPALLNDKTAKGRGSYRIIQEGTGQEESSGKGMFSISRKDVGGFIAGLLGGNDDVQKWWGCQPVLAY